MLCVGHKLEVNKKKNYQEGSFPYYLNLYLLERKTGVAINQPLSPGTNIGMSIISHHCMICMEPSVEEVCSSCSKMPKGDDLDLEIRNACNYRDGDSFLAKEACTPENFPCNIENNALSCHGNYYLYIGRFNNCFKVGISKSSRGKTSRISEQGLNEALVMGGIKGLPAALELENYVSETLRIPMSITTDQKIDSFTSFSQETLKTYIPSVLELDDLKHLSAEYINLYPDFRNEERFQRTRIAEGSSIEGDIIWLQGSILLLTNGTALNVRDLRYMELEGIL